MPWIHSELAERMAHRWSSPMIGRFRFSLLVLAVIVSALGVRALLRETDAAWFFVGGAVLFAISVGLRYPVHAGVVGVVLGVGPIISFALVSTVRNFCKDDGLSIGSFFAAVANSYITSSLIPDTGTATLADQINAIGMIVIGVVIFQSIISQFFHDKEENVKFGKLFDWVSFVVLLLVFVVLNVALPLAASITQ